jgi:uncharacterized membrane-anchored protein YhcB (DUF1043 family)
MIGYLKFTVFVVLGAIAFNVSEDWSAWQVILLGAALGVAYGFGELTWKEYQRQRYQRELNEKLKHLEDYRT